MKSYRRCNLIIYSGFLFWLTACSHRGDCNTTPRLFADLSFEVRNAAGQSLVPLPPANVAVPAPDSIRLRSLTSGQVYSLRIGANQRGEGQFGVDNYKGVTGQREVLQLQWGNAVADTFEVQIGTIRGWRGDECAWVADPGVTEVRHRNRVIYQYQEYSDSAFTIKR